MGKHYRMKQLAEMSGIGLSTIWRWSKDDPDFPELISLSPAVTVVREQDWLEYIEKKAQQHRRTKREVAPA